MRPISNTRDSASFPAVPLREEVTLVYSYRTKVLTLYINGKKDTTCGGITYTPGKLPHLTNAFIGKSSTPTDPYLTAAIRNFRWYHGSLRYVLCPGAAKVA